MNELQKEYFERLAREEAEAQAMEEARLKAFMEEERKKDAERKEKEKKEKIEKEEADRIAAEEAERKAEEEAAEIINRMKAKITEDRKKEKEAEARKKADEASKTAKSESGSGKEETKSSETDKTNEVNIAGSEKAETGKSEVTKTGTAKPEAVKEVVKPAADGAKKATSPKFKKGGKKAVPKEQASARPKPQEAAAAQERPLKPDNGERMEASKAEELKEQKKQSRTTGFDAEKKTVKDSPDSMSEETVEVENLEGTVEDTEPDNRTEEPADDTVKKASPEEKAAADREAKWKEAAEEAQDKYKRLLAEFENARAREAKEAAQKYDLGAKSVLEKLLPIVDNFERAIQTIPEEDKERAFEQGVDKIYKQMMTILEDIGVTPMNAEGTEFNPDLHNAVMHVEDDAYGENVVAEEMQKGYMYKDTVLRYSMVKVAN